ncbi:hypothetical protein CFELI_04105 [Corynebacterium felinum]|nr:hypothetical protein CFELI_04105 [Corynebacterium felinum]
MAFESEYSGGGAAFDASVVVGVCVVVLGVVWGAEGCVVPVCGRSAVRPCVDVVSLAVGGGAVAAGVGAEWVFYGGDESLVVVEESFESPGSGVFVVAAFGEGVGDGVAVCAGFLVDDVGEVDE